MTQIATRATIVDDDKELLLRVSACLPILADLSRGDAFLFTSGDNPGFATLIGMAQPGCVPSVRSGLGVGDQVSSADEPAILQALTRGARARHSQRIRATRDVTFQDTYPVEQAGRIIGVVAIEISRLERERLQTKSLVYRRTLSRFRAIVAAGQLRGVSELTRLDEHDGIMIVSNGGEIVYISAVAAQFYRKVGETQNLLHRNLGSLPTDESVFFKAVEANRCVERSMQEGQYTWHRRAIPLIESTGGYGWKRVLASLEPGHPIILTVNDVTEQARKDRELRVKSVMIQEIHHRVKNNLQTIASLLRLQARRTGSPEVSTMLQETISRILSIAVVHEFLARQESGDVDTREIARQIMVEVSRSILDPEKRVHFTLDAVEVFLPTQQATSVALVMNELLHNAVEHAFVKTNEGHVSIQIRTTDQSIVIAVSDDGVGLPPRFNVRETDSLGLQIVQTLVRDDLKGTFQLIDGEERGARGIVSFPRNGLG